MSLNNVMLTMERANEQLQSILAPSHLLSDKEYRKVIARYTAATARKFQCWLGATLIASSSELGRSVTEANLRSEIQENHCHMLQRFAASAGAEPDSTDHRSVARAVETIDTLVSNLSGVQCIALMALLEADILVYPYLASLATKVGSSDLEYTEVHLAEDPHHAAQFKEALLEEIKIDNAEVEQKIDSVVRMVTDLYQRIFHTSAN